MVSQQSAVLEEFSTKELVVSHINATLPQTTHFLKKKIYSPSARDKSLEKKESVKWWQKKITKLAV